MSRYTYIVRSMTCRRVEEIDEAIEEQNPAWEGLRSAEQIISIQWVPQEQLYYVSWRVRKWMDGTDGS